MASAASYVLADARLAPAAVPAAWDQSGWWRVVEDPADPSPARAVEIAGSAAHASSEDLVRIAETVLAGAFKAGMRGAVFVKVKLQED